MNVVLLCTNLYCNIRPVRHATTVPFSGRHRPLHQAGAPSVIESAPEAWQTVLGRSLAAGLRIDVTLATRTADGLPVLKVILVGFEYDNKRPSAGKYGDTNYLPPKENEAVRHHLNFTHPESEGMAGRKQHSLETAVWCRDTLFHIFVDD